MEPIALSALEHHQYCPRQCALIHVDGVWSDNVHTARGHRGHRRVDSGEHRSERGRLVLRGIPLWSERLGLTGRADAVELFADGRMVPVEYKIGTRHGLAADVQLCAQALCLEEMTSGTVSEGALWFSAHRRRETVAMGDGLRGLTTQTISEVRSNLNASQLPPAPNDARCDQCQLLGHCLPDTVARPDAVDRYLREVVFSCES
ncbi:MAG: CRISPR-associated protein Cas4 [Acidimicrobiales bacterium]